MKISKYTTSLYFQFAMYLFAFTLVISLSFLLIFSFQLKRLINTRLMETGKNLISNLALNSVDPLFNEMYPSLSETIKMVKINPDTLSAEILDRSNTIVAATNTSLIGTKVEISRKQSYREYKEKIVFTKPVYLYRQYLGYVVLSLSKSRSINEMNRLYRKWIAITILIIFAAFMLAILASRKVTSPLTDLTNYTAMLGKGDYSVKMKSAKSRELTLITEALTSMANAIITREKKTKALNKKLSEQNALLKSIINGPPSVNIWSVDKEYRYTFFNNAHKQGMKEVWDADIEIGKSILEYLPKDYREFVKNRYDEDLTGKVSQLIEKHTTRDGRTMFFKNVASSIYNTQGEVTGMTAFAINITEQKEAENKLKEALKEKEVLLKEVHHRVKNNLQIIASLLNLQQAKLTDPKSMEVFTESINRVMSIALIHEQLYSTGNYANINIRYYLENLLNSLQSTFYDEKYKVKITHKMDDVYLNLNQAIPLGLICNEIITNSFKHAFEGIKNPSISVRMHMENDRSIYLKIEDNGVGDQPVKDTKETGNGISIGTTLIEALTDQIGGTFEIKAKGAGTAFILHLPIKDE